MYHGDIPFQGGNSYFCPWSNSCQNQAGGGGVLWNDKLRRPSDRAMPRTVPKLSSADRAILDRIACMSKEQLLRLKFEEINAYLRIIDKLDPAAIGRELEEVCVDLGATNADIRLWAERATWKH